MALFYVSQHNDRLRTAHLTETGIWGLRDGVKDLDNLPKNPAI